MTSAAIATITRFVANAGVVYDVEMPSEDLLSSVRDTHGFHIEGFDIIFTGFCPDCANPKE